MDRFIGLVLGSVRLGLGLGLGIGLYARLSDTQVACRTLRRKFQPTVTSQ